MLIKVCGLRDAANILQVARLQPDMMGFIFYSRSPRNAEKLNPSVLSQIPNSIKKIGVFVNEDLENILTIIRKYNLDGVQLHGAENFRLCQKLKEKAKVMVIKAFPIMTDDNFKVTNDYESVCDYFLFDTKTDVYGGSGLKFDWTMLNAYHGNKDFILSGGISADDIEPILKINHPKMAGIDLNSKFEIKPGLKDIEKLKYFIHEIRNRNELIKENKNEQN